MVLLGHNRHNIFIKGLEVWLELIFPLIVHMMISDYLPFINDMTFFWNTMTFFLNTGPFFTFQRLCADRQIALTERATW